MLTVLIFYFIHNHDRLSFNSRPPVDCCDVFVAVIYIELIESSYSLSESFSDNDRSLFSRVKITLDFVIKWLSRIIPPYKM